MTSLPTSILISLLSAVVVNSQRINYASGKSNIITEYIDIGDGNTQISAFVAHNFLYSVVKPAVLVVPDWGGKENYEIDEAIKLAEHGYVGIAIDLYNSWNSSEDYRTKFAYAYPQENRTDFLKRLQIAVDKARGLDNTYIDSGKIAAVGFGYGGMAALDLARTGRYLAGVVSYYANLTTLDGAGRSLVIPKILVLTGYDDYDVNSTMVAKFQDEMRSKDADWTLVSYGNTKSRFTVPGYYEGRGAYSVKAHKRSLQATKSFFREIFDEDKELPYKFKPNTDVGIADRS